MVPSDSMAFSDYKVLSEVLKKFTLTTREQAGLFAKAPTVEPSSALITLLKRWVPLATAIATEKARSEYIVAPLLAELTLQSVPLSLFSGVDFSVSPEDGLNGECDFLLSRSAEQYFISSPIVALVEAKNESIKSGLGQCIAEMLAAQRFNQREGNPITTVYGAVTTGTNWKFLSLTDHLVSIDMDEYLIVQPERILGILLAMIAGTLDALVEIR